MKVKIYFQNANNVLFLFWPGQLWLQQINLVDFDLINACFVTSVYPVLFYFYLVFFHLLLYFMFVCVFHRQSPPLRTSPGEKMVSHNTGLMNCARWVRPVLLHYAINAELEVRSSRTALSGRTGLSTKPINRTKIMNESLYHLANLTINYL